MKIAILADAYLTDESTGVNGTQVQLYQLAHAFAERGHDVHYICSTRNAKFRREARDGAIKLHYLPEREGMFAWVAELRDARRQLSAIVPDAIYQRGRSPLTFAAARWAGRHTKSFVWGSNGEDSGEFFKYRGRLFRSKRSYLRKLLLLPDMWLRDLCVHRGLAGAKHIISQTEHQRSRVRANFAKDAVVLPSYFHAPTQATLAARERMVLWLANLSPGKQPEEFIDMAAVLADFAGWRFVLAGGTSDGAFVTALRERAAKVENLEFAGRIPFVESGTLFARAALYVNTSRPDADGLPNAYIQAWLSGTPVLSLHHDPNGWIAEHGLGFYAQGSPERLIGETRRLLANPTAIEAMGHRCKAFARETFANASVIDTYLRLFSSRAVAAR